MKKGIMRFLITVLVLIFAFGLPLCGQPLDDVERCATVSELEQRLHDCSQAIASGQISNADLAATFYNRGSAYYSAGNYEKAVADYDQAIRLDPSFSLGFYARGAANNARSNYSQAIRDYDEAIRLDPVFAFAYEGRGYARFLLGQFSAAEADFAKTLELTPGYQDAALWSFLARSRAGQEALSQLERNAAQLKLTEWQGDVINLFLGKVTPEAVLSANAGAGRKADAERLGKTYFYVAEHALTLGSMDQARRLFQQAIEAGNATSIEYAAARTELKAIAPPPPAQVVVVPPASESTVAQSSPREPVTPAFHEIKIAVLLPFSGPISAYGIMARDAVRLAIDEWNAKDGVWGMKIVPIFKDSACLPSIAAGAADKAIHEDGVHYIVGDICSKASVPISELANANRVVQISIGSTNPAVTVLEDGTVKEYIYRACFIDPFQGTIAAKFALNTLRVRKAFIMVKPTDRYVKGQVEGFEADFRKGGGRIVGKGTYFTDEKDFSRIVAKIAAAKPDIVYLPDNYDVVNLAIKQAREKGIHAIFIGGDAWDSDDLDFAIAAGSFFTGHYSANDRRPEVQKFVQAFSAKHKDKDGRPKAPGVLAALAYDATNLMLTAIRDAAVDDPARVKEALNGINFSGVTGQITYDANHNPVKSGVIFAVKSDKIVFDTEVNP